MANIACNKEVVMNRRNFSLGFLAILISVTTALLVRLASFRHGVQAKSANTERQKANRCSPERPSGYYSSGAKAYRESAKICWRRRINLKWRTWPRNDRAQRLYIQRPFGRKWY